MSSISCPSCESEIQLPEAVVQAGLPKVKCPHCGDWFQVFPGGIPAAFTGGLGTGGLSPSHRPVQSSGSGSMPQPGSVAFSGPQGPNLSVPEYFAGQSGGYASSASGISSGGPGFSYPELRAGEIFRDKWKIEGEIGRGGSAVVYKALDQDAEIPVALKVVGMVGEQADVLRKAWAEEFKSRRLVADGRHLLHIESPVVEVRQNVTYVALPQELGVKTFRDWLTETKANLADRQEEGLRLFKEMCLGVETLHAAGLSHLDLKPENVLLVEDPVQGKNGILTAKVGDFGLARAAGSLRRREGAGTPQYMSPEQVRSAREKEIGHLSDIYSLGCILFELLDGLPPFSGSAEELKQKHLEVAPPELEDVAAQYETVVMACLSKNRKDRPESVKELRLSLEIDPEEEKAYQAAKDIDAEEVWQGFLKVWNKGFYAGKVKDRLKQLERQRIVDDALIAGSKLLAEEKYDQALQHYLIAGEADHPDAQAKLGDLYMGCPGIGQDINLAMNWYAKAEANGNVHAKQELDKYRAEQAAKQRAMEEAERKAEAERKLKAEKAKLKLDAENALESGIGFQQSGKIEEAIAQFTIAAEYGIPDAQYLLAEFYLSGDGITADFDKALAWLEKAAEKDHKFAQNKLGEIFLDGLSGVSANPKKGIKYIELAAKQGLAIAQFNMGNCYLLGKGIKKNKKMAVEFFNLAAEQGQTNAIAAIEKINREEEERKKQAAEKRRKQAEVRAKKKEDALSALAEGLELIANEHFTDGVESIRKAAEYGLSEALFELGECYYHGRGVERNLSSAIEWYEKVMYEESSVSSLHNSAQKGTTLCYFEIGRELYEAGDFKQALHYFKESDRIGYLSGIDLRLAENCYYMGVCYEKGLGTEANLYRAVKFYDSAAQHGSANGAYAHGRLKVTLSREKSYRDNQLECLEVAIQSYKLASMLGHNEADTAHGDTCYKAGLICEELAQKGYGSSKSMYADKAKVYFEEAKKSGSKKLPATAKSISMLFRRLKTKGYLDRDL